MSTSNEGDLRIYWYCIKKLSGYLITGRLIGELIGRSSHSKESNYTIDSTFFIDDSRFRNMSPRELKSSIEVASVKIKMDLIEDFLLYHYDFDDCPEGGHTDH